MKYLSTFEVAENGGSLPGELVSSATMTAYRAHSGQEAAGSSRQTLRNRPMPASKAENISSRKLTDRRKHNGRYLFTCRCPKKNH